MSTTPYELLTEQDIQNITSYIEYYGNESKGKFRTPLKASLDHILRFWNQDKDYLFHLLGEQLIVKKHIELPKSQELMNRGFYETQKFYKFLKKVRKHIVFDFFENPELNVVKGKEQEISYSGSTGYIEIKNMMVSASEKWAIESILNLESVSDWTNNKYYGSDHEIQGPYGTASLINGQKMTKTLKKIVQAFYPKEDTDIMKELEDAIVDYSMVVNDKKLKGNLCLSIHPLDYMTMSHNSLRWRSCMKWDSEGCYKAGTVEMMNSPCVLEAYLEGSTPMKLKNGITWNNKKWRCLYIVDKDFIMHIKEYPFTNEQINKAAISFIAELANKNCDADFHESDIVYDSIVDEEDEYYIENEYFDEDNFCEIFTGSRIINTFYTSLMYNDIYENEGLCHMYLTNRKKCPEVALEYAIDYSGTSECMFCGDTEVEETNSLTCVNCEVHKICEHCNNRFPVDAEGGTTITLRSGREVFLCAECLETRASELKFTCPLSGKEIFFNTQDHVNLSLCSPINDGFGIWYGDPSITSMDCDQEYLEHMMSLPEEEFFDSEVNPWAKLFRRETFDVLRSKFNENGRGHSYKTILFDCLTEEGIKFFDPEYKRFTEFLKSIPQRSIARYFELFTSYSGYQNLLDTLVKKSFNIESYNDFFTEYRALMTGDFVKENESFLGYEAKRLFSEEPFSATSIVHFLMYYSEFLKPKTAEWNVNKMDREVRISADTLPSDVYVKSIGIDLSGNTTIEVGAEEH